MSISSVSFGKVIAVSGKRKSTQYLRNEMSKTSNITALDATSHYMSSATNGLLHNAAKRGDIVDIYVTGKDNIDLKNKKEGWKTLNDVLSHIDKYYNLRKISTTTVKEALKESN